MKKLLIVFCLLPVLADAQLCGIVVNVHDGDTFTLLVDGKRQVKVRLHGIDCPERGQDYGTVARDYVADRIAGHALCIDSMGRDRYGRVIALIPYDGSYINSMLLAEGLAWHYKKYDKSPEWAQMEETAKRDKKGLWEQPCAVAPWEWRKKGK